MSETAKAIQEFEDATSRVVAELYSLNFEIVHMRDDVEGRYSGADLDEAYQLIMANRVSSDDFKQIVEEAQCKAQALFFETIIAFIFPSDRYQAVFASFDYRVDFPVSKLVQQVSEINSTG